MAVKTRTGSSKSAPKIPQLAWSEAKPAAVVLITGPETLLADRASQSIRQQLREHDPALEEHEVEAAAYASGELFTLASPSLFGEPRLIRVAGVETCSDAFIADMKTYLLRPDDTTTLVLRHGGGQRGKAVLDAIRRGDGGGVEVLCPEIKAGDRIGFVRQELSRLGAQITPGALSMLTDAFQGSLDELIATCGQLAADDKAQITETEVERLTGGRVEANAFRVADAAIAGRASEALVMLRQSLSTGTAAIPLLAAINLKIRAMARVYGARGSSGQLAREFGMAPWQAERAMREVRGWREADLARAIGEAAATELKLKGGTRDSAFALERYVLLIARKGREQ